MPRCPRRFSDSGIYHVVQRGNGRSILFEDDSDRSAFLRLVAQKKAAFGIGVLGWCLMSNHVHLLIDDPRQKLSAFLHDVFTAYAGRFNARSGHVGSVFQGRFHSVAIQNEGQLLAALKYIHMNPERAGIAPMCEYPWSSYGAYAGADEARLLDAAVVFGIVGDGDGFAHWSASADTGGYSFHEGKGIPVEDELEVARYVLDGDPSCVKGMPRVVRDAALQRLRSQGFTIRQIERLTGIGRSTISRHTSAGSS